MRQAVWTLGALHDAGGQQYLTQQARENPTAFLTLLGKVLPTTINANARITMDPSEMTDAEIVAELAATRVADGTAEEEGGRRAIGSSAKRIADAP
jgi:hypothetical protein